jgi:hypothetical protein
MNIFIILINKKFNQLAFNQYFIFLTLLNYKFKLYYALTVLKKTNRGRDICSKAIAGERLLLTCTNITNAIEIFNFIKYFIRNDLEAITTNNWSTSSKVSIN